MKYLLMLMLLISCNSQSKEEKPKLSTPVAVTNLDDADSYTVYKHVDEDAICYMMYGTESVTISCVAKNK